MGSEWAQQPISQVATSQYTFMQFITALHGSLQLREEISRAQALTTNYGQYMIDPRSPRSKHGFCQGRRSSFYHDSGRYPQRQESRSRSPSCRSRWNSGDRRPNPNFRKKRFCYGCGSPDHILRDRKCTPRLADIKTNLIDDMGCMVEHAEFLAEELLTLHISNDTTANTLERSSNPTLKRNEYPDAPQYTHKI